MGTFHLASDLWMKAGSFDYRLFGSAVGNAAYNPDSKTSIWGYINRAGIQIFPTANTSIVAGLSQSTFDFANPNVDAVAGMGPNNSYTVASTFTLGGMNFLGAASNTSITGIPLIALKTQFGSGWTATVSVEDSTYRRNAVWDAGTNALLLGAFPGPTEGSSKEYRGNCYPTSIGNGTTDCLNGDYAAQQVPDIVGSLRVDQAWGSAQIAGALHQVRAGFYGNNFPAGSFGPGGFTGVAPEDKWGWAVNAGVVVNLPWAAGDRFWVDGAYTVGAVSYTGFSQNGLFGNFLRFNGNTVGQGGLSTRSLPTRSVLPRPPRLARWPRLRAFSSPRPGRSARRSSTTGRRGCGPRFGGPSAELTSSQTATQISSGAPRGRGGHGAARPPNFPRRPVLGIKPHTQNPGARPPKTTKKAKKQK